jgi:hypothetical protein
MKVNMHIMQIWVATCSARNVAGCPAWLVFGYPRRKTVPMVLGARERPTKPASTKMVTT